MPKHGRVGGLMMCAKDRYRMAETQGGCGRVPPRAWPPGLDPGDAPGRILDFCTRAPQVEVAGGRPAPEIYLL
jgi:hypothetical protein